MPPPNTSAQAPFTAADTCTEVAVTPPPASGALPACRQFLGGEPKAVVVVVPTQHLKHQWADAAARVGRAAVA